MTYPIEHNGKVCGELRIYRSGLYTVAEARCGADGEILRLWLVGSGKTEYIGVMMPSDRGLVLKKSFTRAEAESWPQSIEKVIVSEREPSAQKRTPEKAPDGWKERERCLTRHENGITLVALPTTLDAGTPGVRIIEIKGEKYIVFKH